MKRIFLLLLLLSFSACSPKKGESYADNMHREHEHDVPTATPITQHSNANVLTSNVMYGRVNEQILHGYLAVPKNSANQWLPAVVVIHEWWGLNDNIKAMAEKLAEQGYRALAVDLYDGKVAAQPNEAMELFKAATGDVPKSQENMKAAFNYLKTQTKTTKVGSIGWCMGGMMSLQLALALPSDVNATVIYYGNVQADRAQLAQLKMPILGFFGGQDTGIPVDGVRAFETTLKELKKNATITIYPDANHAFANPSGRNYRALEANDAWTKTMTFFNQYLK